VHALVRLAVLLARLARELDAARREEGAPGRGVDHLDEPSVYMYVSILLLTSQNHGVFIWALLPCIKVDFRRQRGDGHERGRADGEDGGCVFSIINQFQLFMISQRVHMNRIKMAPRCLLNEISDEVFTTYVMETTNLHDLKDMCGYKPGKCMPHARYGYDPSVVVPWPSMGGQMRKRLKDRIQRLNLSTKHHKKTLRKMKPVHLLKSGRRNVLQLCHKLEASGREYICEWCRCEGMTPEHGKWLWRDWPLVLQVDHINGLDGTDDQDRLDNLRYLCPTCHAQTSNYCGTHNNKRGKKKAI